MSVVTGSPPPPLVVPPFPVRRFTVYRSRVDYRGSELVTFVLNSEELGPIAAQELLP